MTEGSYPPAIEGAEESGPAKEPTHPAVPSRARLPTTLTGHIPHTPVLYRMTFRSPEDPFPWPPYPVSIRGQGPAPGTLTADPPSRHAPVLAGSGPHPPANIGFGVEYNLTARRAKLPAPEVPQPSPPAPLMVYLFKKWQEVAPPHPSKMPLVYRKLQDTVPRVSSSSVENKASFESSKELPRENFSSCKAFQM